MAFDPIEKLQPGRLVLLIFKGMINGRWIGYVDKDGLCEWPDQVRGQRPTGWQEVSADLSRIKALRFSRGSF
ncbi:MULTISPECIES: hypothetical protein [unclassified Rhizobium]|uniref:hypothetical protein n=1 Tax=unclassified Rhizobium TaxID=2613769 RepID=UPI001AE67A7B|nr:MULTISPECIES: hypothetical protein [unclassified Rhizobium]MBP2460156.1 hypothetical protein [Rhizobium sp. PvP014]MBP2531515.1 hypothetical protein [Rhizobium sp. PvP099]